MWKLVGAIASALASGVGLFLASRDYGREDQKRKDEALMREANETAAAATDILNMGMAQESDEAPVEE